MAIDDELDARKGRYPEITSNAGFDISIKALTHSSNVNRAMAQDPTRGSAAEEWCEVLIGLWHS